MSEQPVDSALEPSNPEVEAERPAWLPANFKEPEALVKSYESAQAELTRAKQEAAAARAALEAVEAEREQATQAQQYQQQQNDLVARYEQAYESGDIQSMLAINAYIAQEAARKAAAEAAPKGQGLPPEFVADYATNAIKAKYGDYDEYAPRVADYLAQNNYLVSDEVAANPQALAQRLEAAYLTLKGQDAVAGNLPQSTGDLSAAKQAAQTLSGAGVRQPSPDADKAEWERIKAAAQAQPGRYW